MLTIIRGIPGSGKSTYAAKHFPNARNFENDQYHIGTDGVYRFKAENQPKAVKWCFDSTEKELAKGNDVVVSNTFTQKRFVDSYVNLAKKYNHPYQVIRLKTQFKTIHNVPEKTMESMRKYFEDYEGETIVE